MVIVRIELLRSPNRVDPSFTVEGITTPNDELSAVLIFIILCVEQPVSNLTNAPGQIKKIRLKFPDKHLWLL